MIKTWEPHSFTYLTYRERSPRYRHAFRDMLNDPVDRQVVFRGPSVWKAPFSCDIV